MSPVTYWFRVRPERHQTSSILFYHIAQSIKTCHMLMAKPSTYDMFAFLKNLYVFMLDNNKRNRNLSYVEGWAINIWLVYVFIFQNLDNLKQKQAIYNSYISLWRAKRWTKPGLRRDDKQNCLTIFFTINNSNMLYIDGWAISIQRI